MYGMVSQMRRAAVSVPSNIAEGQARNTPNEFAHFLSIAQGSLAELETQMIIANDIGYMAQQPFIECCSLHNEVSKMLSALKTAIKSNKTGNWNQRLIIKINIFNKNY